MEGKGIEIIKGHTLNRLEKHLLEDSYSNMLAWWRTLSEDWKTLLLLKRPIDSSKSVDINSDPPLEFLNNLRQVKEFNNYYYPLKTLKPLNFFQNVERLVITDISINDFSEISDKVNIRTIIADDSKLQTLNGLENFEKLELLTVLNTDIESIKPILSLKKMKILDIRGTLVDPSEVEMYGKLHPNVEVRFITVMNPLRRKRGSLENPIFDAIKERLDQISQKDYQLFQEGVKLFTSKRFHMAIEKFNEAISINAKNARYYLARAGVNGALGDYHASLSDYDFAINIGDENQDEIYFLRGLMQMSMKEPSRGFSAIKDIEKAISINPNVPKYYEALKSVHLRLNNNNRVIEILNRLIQLVPTNNDYYYDRALTYGRLLMWKELIQDMTLVIWANPNDAEALYNRGVAYQKLGRLQDAIKDYSASSNLGNRKAKLAFG